MHDEQEHGQKSADEHVPEDQRPQVHEHDLDVEGHEQQGVDVEGQPDPAPRVAECVDARFIGQTLVPITLRAMADEPREADRDQHECRARESEPEHVPKTCCHATSQAPRSADGASWDSWWTAAHAHSTTHRDCGSPPAAAIFRGVAGKVRAYVGLGANMGDARANLVRAVQALAALPGVGLHGRVGLVSHASRRRGGSA